ncbi:MAG: hypothetical protein ABIH03_00350, partial [Pseudomonadota bacterium]
MSTHPEYNGDLIDEYDIWYAGGARFREALKNDEDGRFLVLRRADKERVGGISYRDLRKGRAQYVSEVGRIVANITATILQARPRLVDADSYIEELNSDADGAGTDLSELARRILVEGFVAQRAYLGPSFPATPDSGMDLEQALSAGMLDGKLRFYRARSVLHWSRAGDGRLNSVRVYGYHDDRSRGTWGAIVGRTHRWLVIDDADITTYEFYQTAKDGILKPIDMLEPVADVGSQSHGYARCPIVEYKFSQNFWILDRLADAQKRLFNSEADESFIRSECAHPQRVLKGSPKVTVDADGNQKVMASPVHGIHLDENGDFAIVGPDGAQASWHKEAIERDRGALYAALEALYLGLSQQSQNARQAASAKAIDRSDATMFLAFAAAELEETILSVVRLIKEKRGKVGGV